MTGRRAVGLACAALLGGCTLITDSFLTNEFSGDAYPIDVDTSTGAILVGVRQPAHADREVVLDLLSPFTVLDPGPDIRPSLSYLDLTLLGVSTKGPVHTDQGAIDRARAQLTGAQVVALHPCADDQCTIGAGSAPRPIQGVLGADVLAGDAVRLRLGNDQIFVLPDIGGTDRQRSLACDAVFDSPYRGGGTLVFPSTELTFGNRRITLQACLGPDPDPGPAATSVASYHPRGADVLLVMSTSIGVSLLGEAAYARYRVAHKEAPELAALATDSVYLPSGLVTGRRATIAGIALVASSTSNPIAPCRQVYAHRLLTTFELTEASCQESLVDCPCENGSPFCPVPGILELLPETGMTVLVVPDTNATLQALRTELRPDQPEVDGLIGTDVLRAAELDVDYPHDRLLARCMDAGCSARPELARTGDLCQINRCIRGAGPQPACPEGPSLRPVATLPR